MNALAKAHQQMREDDAPPELLRGAPSSQVPAVPSNSNAPPVSEATAIIRLIEAMARDTSLPLDRLEKIIELQERLAIRHAETAFNEAMARAQTEMRTVALDSNNPQTRSKYASYAALDRAVRPIYTKHGFALSFNTGMDAPDQHVRVLCDVSNGGYTRRYHIDMPADGKGARGGDVMSRSHATGSALSYGQRYLLKLIFNVSTGESDDDGNAAGDGGFITDEQATIIRDLIDEVGADIKRFCAYFKVEGIAKIPAKQYDRAVAALNAKRRAS
jgi:hypothetical protein